MFTTLAASWVVGRQQIGAVSPVYALPGQNHQQPDRVIHTRRTGEALICRWRQSSVTGRLECVWESERIVAAPIEEGPSAVSGDLNRYSGLQAA
jgi:hypothetical protein